MWLKKNEPAERAKTSAQRQSKGDIRRTRSVNHSDVFQQNNTVNTKYDFKKRRGRGMRRGGRRRTTNTQQHVLTGLSQAHTQVRSIKLFFSVPPIGHAPPTKNHGFVALESTTCRVALYTGSEELTKPRYGKLSNDGTFASSMCIALPNPSVS